MGQKHWEEMTIAEVAQDLQTDLQKGLSTKETRRRISLVGLNRLKEQKKIAPVALFLAQFRDFMVLVLIAAAFISVFLGELADAVTILAIVIMNAGLGFLQEYRAEKSLEKLKKLTAQETTVKRDGMLSVIPAAELVPGDVVLLKTGDIIPADVRIGEADRLEVDEAVLTGESLPVSKCADVVCSPKTPLGDRRNMAFMGTVVTRGKGAGLVVGTGMATEMGQIAGFIQEVEEGGTPLQKRLAQLGRWLVFCCLLIVGIVVLLGLLRGEPLYRMVLTGVSLAVAAIPEGLPAIVTVVLAIGVQKMVKRQAIVRALPAVETLGCATVICSDKTGTLTRNEMTVRLFCLGEETVTFSGEGYAPHGKISFTGGAESERRNRKGWELACQIAALCNNAYLKKKEMVLTGLFRQGKAEWQILGDPTEGALLVAAGKGGFWREALEKERQKIAEFPFDSERKRMSVVYRRRDGRETVYTKGAPDVLLNLCSKVWWEGEIIPLSPEIKAKILAQNDRLAAQALRVLGLCYRELSKEESTRRKESRPAVEPKGEPGRESGRKPGQDHKAVQESGREHKPAPELAQKPKPAPELAQEPKPAPELGRVPDAPSLRDLGPKPDGGQRCEPEPEQEKNWERDLVFVALAGMIDPPRKTAQQAVKQCKRAGIKTVMITGDHKKTAEAVARELQILAPLPPAGQNDRAQSGQMLREKSRGNGTAFTSEVMTGPELDELSDVQLKKVVNRVSVFARVSPRHKLRIVRALKGAGHVVAMTGDGVNDAPAVKEADIGVSMGISGSDVTREASALILANDDFATIVAAVEEGRIIYDNIRKFIRYLLSCNVGEVLTMFLAAFCGLPLPLVPIQILWLNLVTDGLPAMALGLDPGDPGVMSRKPRHPRESIFAHGLGGKILATGAMISVETLAAFVIGYYWGGLDLLLARTMAFTTLVFAQLTFVFQCRSESFSLRELGYLSNPYLVGAVFCSAAMQWAVLYVPFFQGIFQTVPLQTAHWLLVFGLIGGITLLQGLMHTVKIRGKGKIIYEKAL